MMLFDPPSPAKEGMLVSNSWSFCKKKKKEKNKREKKDVRTRVVAIRPGIIAGLQRLMGLYMRACMRACM